MTTEKKINSEEIMSLEQLDNVTGGATGTIYFFKKDNNTFIGLKVTGTFRTRAEVEEAYARAKDINPYNIQDGIDGRFTISKAEANMFERGMRARGYDFVPYEKLRRG